VTFSVTCSAVAPVLGAIQVTTTTSGEDQDQNGYQLTIDGGSSQGIGRNETKTIDNVTPGPHTVTLSDVATNCTAVELSQNVTVTAGATTNVSFTVTCTAIPPTTGTIRVTTATSGQSQDVNGYDFRVDAGATKSIGINDTKQVDNVSAGSHSVTLSDVAANCSADELSKNVTVVAGTTLNVQFTITCVAAPSASQSNIAVDPNRIVAGLSSSDVIVTVRDAAGRRLSGVQVIPGSSGNGGVFTPTSLQTDGDGVAIFSFSSTESGAKTISATAGGVLIQDTEVISVDAQGTETAITSVDPPTGTASAPVSITVHFSVTAEAGGTPTNGTVTVFSQDESNTSGCIDVAVAAGSCSMVLTTPNEHHLQATYTPGTSQYETSTSSPFTYVVTSP
jgi:hypothetical protein